MHTESTHIHTQCSDRFKARHAQLCAGATAQERVAADAALNSKTEAADQRYMLVLLEMVVSFILAVGVIYFSLFIEKWVPSRQFWIQTHPKRSIIVYS